MVASDLSELSRERDFLRNGFVVLEGFLGESNVVEIQPLVESLLRSPRGLGCTRPHNTLVPLRWNDPVVQLILMSERRVKLLREVLEAEDLKWISGCVSITEAQSPALWWHQDWWCWDHVVSYRRAAAQVAILMLSDGDNREERRTPSATKLSSQKRTDTRGVAGYARSGCRRP